MRGKTVSAPPPPQLTPSPPLPPPPPPRRRTTQGRHRAPGRKITAGGACPGFFVLRWCWLFFWVVTPENDQHQRKRKSQNHVKNIKTAGFVYFLKILLKRSFRPRAHGPTGPRATGPTGPRAHEPRAQGPTNHEFRCSPPMGPRGHGATSPRAHEPLAHGPTSHGVRSRTSTHPSSLEKGPTGPRAHEQRTSEPAKHPLIP